jgi:hypothetical protein
VDRPLVRRYGAADWRRLGAIRLEMLADTPLAYAETLAAATAYEDDLWRERATQADEPHRLGRSLGPGQLTDSTMRISRSAPSPRARKASW